MTIEWPVQPGLGSLTCSGVGACANVAYPVPDPSTPYAVECNGIGVCNHGHVTCPTNAECTVNCTGMRSCQYVCIYLCYGQQSDDSFVVSHI